jgi:hypothetical protein
VSTQPMTPLLRSEVEALLPALLRLTRRSALRLRACQDAADGDDPETLWAALNELDDAVADWQAAIRLLGAVPQGLWELELPAHDGAWWWSLHRPSEVRFRPTGAGAAQALH